LKNCEIEIIALELDKEILNKILEINADFDSYEIIKEVAKNHEYEKDNIKIKLILGDAVKTIKNLKEKFDFIFHDPFSTKKMPEFWTEDFFKEEYKLLKKSGILTTYSCAKFVRKNMKRVGFEVKDVPPVGRKSPSTLSIKQ